MTRCCISARNASSTRSQIAWDSATVIVAGYHQMELQERQPAGVAHAQVVRLDGAGGALGYQVADAVHHGGFRRGVHQAADRHQIIAMPDHST